MARKKFKISQNTWRRTKFQCLFLTQKVHHNWNCQYWRINKSYKVPNYSENSTLYYPKYHQQNRNKRIKNKNNFITQSDMENNAAMCINHHKAFLFKCIKILTSHLTCKRLEHFFITNPNICTNLIARKKHISVHF